MIVLAMLIGWYAVYGAGRQVVTDGREGIRNTRERAVRRVGEIRKDRRASRVKRVAATGAVWTGQGAGVVWRGARHTGRSITTGVRWGAGEGRERHRERVELGEVQTRIGELGDRETDAGITDETPEYAALHEEFYALRDQHRADRAGRAGRPVPRPRPRPAARRVAPAPPAERAPRPQPARSDRSRLSRPQPVRPFRRPARARLLAPFRPLVRARRLAPAPVRRGVRAHPVRGSEPVSARRARPVRPWPGQPRRPPPR